MPAGNALNHFQIIFFLTAASCISRCGPQANPTENNNQMKQFFLVALFAIPFACAFSRPGSFPGAHPEGNPEGNPDSLPALTENRHDAPNTLNVSFNGYLETFYSYNFNRPANNINALRGFDFIANSLTVGNFVVGTDAKYNNFSTRLAINIGMTPTQFYKQEPMTPPSYQIPSLSSATWQFIQEAVVNYDFPGIPGLSAQMGIMATPIGIEGLPGFQTWQTSTANPGMHIKDYRENWNFSRSNAFMFVPDYHSGLRILYSPSHRSTYSFYLINGQNSITDNNAGKTISISYLWTPNHNTHVSFLYMGGNERPTDYAIAKSWRHLFDIHTRFSIGKRLAMMAQVVPGMETTAQGNNRFLINTAYLKYKTSKKNYLAARYEHLLEEIFPGSASNFLESFDDKNKAGLYSFTGTFSHVLVEGHLLLRIEYRHDFGTQQWFYRGALQPAADPKQPFVANAWRQNTVSFSLVGWF